MLPARPTFSTELINGIVDMTEPFASPLAIAVDATGKAIVLNAAARAVFDVSPAQNVSVTADPCGLLFPHYTDDGEEVAGDALPLQRAVLEGRHIEPARYFIELWNHRVVHAAISATPIRNGGGEVVGGVALMSGLARTSVSGWSWLAGADGTLLWLGDEWAARCDVADLAARWPSPFDASNLAQIARAFAEAAGIDSGLTIACRVQPWYGLNGKIVRWFGTAQPVQAFRPESGAVDALAEAIPQLVWTTTADGKCDYLNSRWIDYSGRDERELLGDGWLESLHPHDRDRTAQAWYAAVEQRASYEVEFRIRRFDGVYRWFLTRGTPVIENGEIIRWFGTCTDIEDRIIGERRTHLLANVGRSLSESANVESVLRAAVASIVPDLADWTLLTLANDQGISSVAAAHHARPDLDARLQTIVGSEHMLRGSHGGTNDAIAQNRAVTAFEVDDELLRALAQPQYLDLFVELQVRSFIVVPLVVGGRIRGTLNAIYGDSERRYTDSDVSLLEEVGRRIALALENAERYEREHRVAVRLQKSSLPASLPEIPSIALDAVYRAASAEALIGGDWYDAFELNDNELVVSVGDVMGHGIDAATSMNAVRLAIRGAAEVSADPVMILDAADRAYSKDHRDRIVTAFVGVINRIDETLRFASAGHPPPFLRRGTGEIEKLVNQGLPLGLRSNDLVPAQTKSLRLKRDDVLVLYTDGLTEVGRDVVQGEHNVEQALREIDCHHAAKDLYRKLLETPEQLPADDVAILSVSYHLLPLRTWSFEAHDVTSLRRLRHDLRTELATLRFDEERIFAAQLVAGELVGNAIRHASSLVEVALECTAHPVLWVRDRGVGFVPTTIAARGALDESGRGLHLVSRFASQVTFTHRPGGGTEVRVTFDR